LHGSVPPIARDVPLMTRDSSAGDRLGRLLAQATLLSDLFELGPEHDLLYVHCREE
jgi:hypothetical protein